MRTAVVILAALAALVLPATAPAHIIHNHGPYVSALKAQKAANAQARKSGYPGRVTGCHGGYGSAHCTLRGSRLVPVQTPDGTLYRRQDCTSKATVTAKRSRPGRLTVTITGTCSG